MATRNDWEGRFNHKAMREVMSYLLTQNMESQTFAIDGTAQDVQSTGTKGVIINGTPLVLAADGAYDISAELPYADWAVSTAYTTAGILSEVVQDGRHFVCILAHTSYAYDHTSSSCVMASSNQPLHGATWQTYWRELDVWAEAGVGNSIAQDMVGYYLCCALADGTLRLFKAYNGTATATTTIVIPAFDPTRYVAIGLLKVSPTSGAHILGTTVLTTVGVFTDLTGPVFPDVTTSDKN